MRISDWSSDVCSSDLVGQLARRIGREVDRDEWIEGHAEVDAARRAVDERGFGDDFAAGGAHRLHRLARRQAGGHDVLDHQHFRARFAREAPAQHDGAGSTPADARRLAEGAPPLDWKSVVWVKGVSVRVVLGGPRYNKNK